MHPSDTSPPLTIACFATPACVGASTAALGLYIAARISHEKLRAAVFSDRPHPELRRREIPTFPSAAYRDQRDCDLAILDLSDESRPRSIHELIELGARFGSSVIWMPIVRAATQSIDFLKAMPQRPVVPLRANLDDPGGDLSATQGYVLPHLEPETRLILERGESQLGYVPRLDLRRWTAAWVGITSAIILAGTRSKEHA